MCSFCTVPSDQLLFMILINNFQPNQNNKVQKSPNKLFKLQKTEPNFSSFKIAKDPATKALHPKKTSGLTLIHIRSVFLVLSENLNTSYYLIQ